MDIKKIFLNIKKILKVLILPIEFLFSIFLAYSIFRFFVQKSYGDIFSTKHLVYITLSSLVIIYIIIYNIKKKVKLEKLVLSFLIPVGMIYLMLVFPTVAADEHFHLFKTYEVSKGVFISSKEEATTVPRDLSVCGSKVKTFANFNDALSWDTDYSDEVEVNNTFKSYPSYLYMFGSIGFVISRALDLNIYIGCLLAKLINFTCFLITIYYSIKILPFGKYVLIGIAFMPMVLHQAVSTSADCMINNIAILFISFITYLIFKEKDINNKELVGLGILGILLAVSKYVYTPIVGMILILLFSKKLSKNKKQIAIPLIIVISGIITIACFMFSNSYVSGHRAYLDSIGQDSAGQVKWIINNPKSFIDVMMVTLDEKSFYFITQMIGSTLGELDINVSYTPIIFYIVFLVVICFIEENKVAFSTKQKIYIMFLNIVSIFLVILSLYISWDGVGDPKVEGVQGRYFIPIAFLTLLCICKKENFVKIKNAQYKILIMACLLNIAPMVTLYQSLL